VSVDNWTSREVLRHVSKLSRPIIFVFDRVSEQDIEDLPVPEEFLTGQSNRSSPNKTDRVEDATAVLELEIERVMSMLPLPSEPPRPPPPPPKEARLSLRRKSILTLADNIDEAHVQTLCYKDLQKMDANDYDSLLKIIHVLGHVDNHGRILDPRFINWRKIQNEVKRNMDLGRFRGAPVPTRVSRSQAKTKNAGPTTPFMLERRRSLIADQIAIKTKN